MQNDWTKRIARLEAERDRLLQRALDQDTRIEQLVEICRALVERGYAEQMPRELAAKVRKEAACPDCGAWPCRCD